MFDWFDRDAIDGWGYIATFANRQFLAGPAHCLAIVNKQIRHIIGQSSRRSVRNHRVTDRLPDEFRGSAKR